MIIKFGDIHFSDWEYNASNSLYYRIDNRYSIQELSSYACDEQSIIRVFISDRCNVHFPDQLLYLEKLYYQLYFDSKPNSLEALQNHVDTFLTKMGKLRSFL